VSGKRKERPYARQAFLNPYNLSLLAGAGVTAAATGHWWIALCAAATEAVWMLFAPDAKLLRAVWDKKFDEAERLDVEERRVEKLRKLLPQDQMRAAALRDQRVRIQQLASENPSLTVDLLTVELAKLDALYEDFLDLALVCARCERHIGTFDIAGLDRSWRAYEQQVKQFEESDTRHEVARKNLDVLKQRHERLARVRKNLQTARGQMDLMENSFRLLADEIVTVADPTELGARLDDLRIGVQAIREASEEGGEAIYEELEEAAPEAKGRR
jgi:hypothetical protein